MSVDGQVTKSLLMLHDARRVEFHVVSLREVMPEQTVWS